MQDPTKMKGGFQYPQKLQEFAQMPTPDPKTFLQLLWNSGILSEMQKEAIAAMLQDPAAAAGGAPQAQPGGAPPAGPAAPMGGPAGTPAAPTAKVSPV